MAKKAVVSLRLDYIGLLWVALFVGLQTLFIVFPDTLNYQRSLVFKSEHWRLVSAHFVHLGWIHAMMNIIAFYLIHDLFSLSKNPLTTTAALVIMALMCSIGLWLFFPDIKAYVGLSGILHGLLAWALLTSRDYPLWLRMTVLLILIGKVTWESTPYYSETDIAQMIGGPVAEQAHLVGLICGMIIAPAFIAVQKYRSTKTI